MPANLIAEITLAIEMGARRGRTIGRTIHPHPTLSESIGIGRRGSRGASCTDLPPAKR